MPRAAHKHISLAFKLATLSCVSGGSQMHARAIGATAAPHLSRARGAQGGAGATALRGSPASKACALGKGAFVACSLPPLNEFGDRKAFRGLPSAPRA